MISIHAPARGATVAVTVSKFVLLDFNPRPREGGDGTYTRCCFWASYFNPRPREGGDVMKNMEIKTYGNFNPRPREGGDCFAAGACIRPR